MPVPPYDTEVLKRYRCSSFRGHVNSLQREIKLLVAELFQRCSGTQKQNIKMTDFSQKKLWNVHIKVTQTLKSKIVHMKKMVGLRENNTLKIFFSNKTTRIS